MGKTGSEEDRFDDETPHEVTISKPFYMGKSPVTQKEYQALTGKNPSYFKGDNLSVEQVSWYDAIAYCNKLSIAEGLPDAHGGGMGVRLPHRYEHTVQHRGQHHYRPGELQRELPL